MKICFVCAQYNADLVEHTNDLLICPDCLDALTNDDNSEND